MAALSGITIYKDPKDCPGMYVARVWEIHEGKIVPGIAITSPINDTALAAIRAGLAEQGLVCSARSPDDDPAILETWL